MNNNVKFEKIAENLKIKKMTAKRFSLRKCHKNQVLF